MPETLKLTITKRWLQNEKDHSKSRKSWDHSRTSWNYQVLGGFITSSMQPSLCRIRKQTYTDPISFDLPRISRTTRNDTKWKQFSDTKNEGEDIDTTSSGKDIRLRKHRGNQQRVLMAVAKKSLTSISAVTTSKNKNPALSTQGALPSLFHPLSPISPSPSRPLNHHPILNMSLQIRQLTKRISSSRLARKISSVFKESTPTTPGTFVPSYPVFSLSDYRPLSLRRPLCCPIFKNGERPSP